MRRKKNFAAAGNYNYMRAKTLLAQFRHFDLKIS